MAAVRLVPTSRPRPDEETLEEALDRIAATLLALSGEVAHLRARITEERSS